MRRSWMEVTGWLSLGPGQVVALLPPSDAGGAGAAGAAAGGASGAAAAAGSGPVHEQQDS